MSQQRISNRPRLPWFVEHVLLLWQMRLAMTQNRVSPAGRYGVYVTAVIFFLPSVALGGFAYWFMTHPSVAAEIIVSQFYLNLLCFVTAMLWVLWPVLSAGVEDGSEKDRYQALPISDTRLLVAAIISGLFRPVGFFMFAPLVGACLGYASSQGIGSFAGVMMLLVAFIAMCATWSQLGVYWLRDILRAKHNGESLTLALLLLVLAGILLPPVDVGWLYEQGGGLDLQNQLELSQFANVAYAFSKIPSGYLGEGLRALADHRWGGAVIEFAGMVILAVLGLMGARSRLVASHHREAATQGFQNQRWDIFSGKGSVDTLLARREAFELWRNPRVRLLVTVPFVLIIVLRLVSANELIVHFFGPISQLWLMGGLGLYGAALLLLTFTHNTFAYDGRGLLVLMGAPINTKQIIQAKARVHRSFSLLSGILVSLFCWRFVLPEVDIFWWLFSIIGIFILVPIVVSTGLWVSVVFPVKFDAALNRRERQPLLVTVLGFSSSLLGALPFIVLSRWAGEGDVTIAAYAMLWMSFIAVIAWLVHGWLLNRISDIFARRQAEVLSAITRV